MLARSCALAALALAACSEPCAALSDERRERSHVLRFRTSHRLSALRGGESVSPTLGDARPDAAKAARQAATQPSSGVSVKVCAGHLRATVKTDGSGVCLISASSPR